MLVLMSCWSSGGGVVELEDLEDLDGARWTLKRDNGSDALSFFPAPRILVMEVAQEGNWFSIPGYYI